VHVLIIIAGALLMLFSGGCVVAAVSLMFFTYPHTSIAAAFVDMLNPLALLGLLTFVAGLFIFMYGKRLERQLWAKAREQAGDEADEDKP
jgi:hypothetical protein